MFLRALRGTTANKKIIINRTKINPFTAISTLLISKISCQKEETWVVIIISFDTKRGGALRQTKLRPKSFEKDAEVKNTLICFQCIDGGAQEIIIKRIKVKWNLLIYTKWMGIHRNDEKNKISFFLSAIKISKKNHLFQLYHKKLFENFFWTTTSKYIKEFKPKLRKNWWIFWLEFWLGLWCEFCFLRKYYQLINLSMLQQSRMNH